MSVKYTFFPSNVRGILNIGQAEPTVSVAVGTASASLKKGWVRVVAVGGDRLIKAGPNVANGDNGLHLTAGIPEVFEVNHGDKIGVSAA